MDNWAWNVAWVSDPVFLGRYPEEGLVKFAEYLPDITEDDMKLISQPIDFMGQNIYNGYMVREGNSKEPEVVNRAVGFPKTASNWPITPECFYWGARFLYERYQHPLYITENGMSCHDMVSSDGQVHDRNRIDFLNLYISALQKASDDGADVRGYFLWTFLDNFEWDKGYNERFGLVHVDFITQKRIAKDSAYWYQSVMESNGRNLIINNPAQPVLFLEPIFKQMVWGGNRLAEDFEYKIPGPDTGECWAVSAHSSGDCTVKEGLFKGKTLSAIWKENPELFGGSGLDRFPLLVKIIDAKEDLSIQVHPDDSYARIHENGALGKTECWYILDCSENASLVIGHNARSKEELSDMIYQGKWEELIRNIPVKKGDFIQIDPGTIHAIKGGMMILETQQNSDITYRVYDYNRKTNGKSRELHVEKSKDVIEVPAKDAKDLIQSAAMVPVNVFYSLISGDYYQVWKLNVNGKMEFEQKQKFLIGSVISGDGLMNGQWIKKGDHFILPFKYGAVKMQGKMELILSAVAKDVIR